jgi:hypothetical protein
MVSIVRSITTTFMRSLKRHPTSIGARGSQTTTSKYSFQSSAAGTSLTEPWESWVMWDLPQKSTGSAPTERSMPTERSAPTSAENRMPSMPSFYKQRQHTPSPSTTLPGPVAPPTSGLRYSASPSIRWNPALDPALPPLPQLAFPQSPLARALITGPITSTYRARSVSCAARKTATVPTMPIVSHVVSQGTTQISPAKRYAYGVAMNTPPPFARSLTLHVQRTSASSPSLTPTTD